MGIIVGALNRQAALHVVPTIAGKVRNAPARVDGLLIHIRVIKPLISRRLVTRTSVPERRSCI